MTDPTPLLSVKDLSCSNEGQKTVSGISFDLHEGDILVLSGKSGSGKTTLLKCLSHLNIYEGEVLLRGRKPSQYGIPQYRTLVLYVPQRPSLLPATPRDFVNMVSSYSSRKQSKRNVKDSSRLGVTGLGSLYSLVHTNSTESRTMRGPLTIAKQWGIDESLWDRPWSSLSGGETQRIALAAAIGIPGAEVLLLDEPTSALDAETTELVETSLQDLIEDEDSTVKAIIWITHSEEQGRRVGKRFLSFIAGNCLESMEMGLPPSRSSRTSTAASPQPVLISL